MLRIFLKLLKEYTPQPEHFVERIVEMQGINFGKAAKPSGFQLMTVFLNDTPTLRMTLSIVDDVAEQLQGFIPNEGRVFSNVHEKLSTAGERPINICIV